MAEVTLDMILAELKKHDMRFDGMQSRFDGMQSRFDRIEANMATQADIARLEGRLDRIEHQLDVTFKQVADHEVRLKDLEGPTS